VLAETVALLAATALAAGGTGLVRRYALIRGRLDVPNARSSHSTPTPRGGGIAIVLVLMTATVALGLSGRLRSDDCLALIAGGLLLALVGQWDDVRGLRVLPRLAAHAAAALLAIFLIASPSFTFDSLHPAVAILLLVFAMLWSINLFNFMDGIDGFAASQATFVFLASAGLIALAGRAAEIPILLLVSAGACAGFLGWNWPPARIFMGDVGSGFLGFWVAAVALVVDRDGLLSVWTITILMSVFIADATCTLLRRVGRRQRWDEAHRSHAYQRLARRWKGHLRVTAALWVTNVLLVLPLAALSVTWPRAAPFIAMLTLAALGRVMWMLGAGSDDGA
jgi:Fuc2NAc and GlcNAc transferase